MDQSANRSKRSNIPRPSRLPVPRGGGAAAVGGGGGGGGAGAGAAARTQFGHGLRASASRDNLNKTSNLASRALGANSGLASRPSPHQRRAAVVPNYTLLQRPQSRISSTETVVRHAPQDQDVAIAPSADNLNPNGHTRQEGDGPKNHVEDFKDTSLNLQDEAMRAGAEDDYTNHDVVEESAQQKQEEREIRSRKSRPSLAERTMETLAQIPMSPMRKSVGPTFFGADAARPESKGGNGSRPGSSHLVDTSMPPPEHSSNSRPVSVSVPRSSPMAIKADSGRISLNTKITQSPFAVRTPSKRPSVPSLKTPSTPQSARLNKKPSSSKLATKEAGESSVKSASKTHLSRGLKPRASVDGLFRKPSLPALEQLSEIDDVNEEQSSPLPKVRLKPRASLANLSSASKETNRRDSSVDATPRKSSLALRDQIAKAKAEKRAQMSSQTSTTVQGPDAAIVPTTAFDFGIIPGEEHEDPFGQSQDGGASKGLLKKRVDAARMDGRLNIAAMDLKEIPAEVMDMYNLDTMNGGSWAEAVDLTRFIAADNEIEKVGDEIFPDIDPRDLDQEDSKGNQFGGLETLDLHGNYLKSVPMGLRRLELLTTLDLSNNKITNLAFEVISQISSLKILKLGRNELIGSLPSSLGDLVNLEILNLSSNTLTHLPDLVAQLTKLRILDVSENKLSAIPFEKLENALITEIKATKNKLDGVLIPPSVSSLPHLQELDISHNAIVLIASSGIALPSLRQLSITDNRITSLPSLQGWTSLNIVQADDNSLTEFPEDFYSLPAIRTIDITGNEIRHLDPRIGLMEPLKTLRIASNPLREKKFSSMATEELKKILRMRLQSEEKQKPAPQGGDGDESEEDFMSAPNSPIERNTSSSQSSYPSSSSVITTKKWQVTSSGVLDISGRGLDDLDPAMAAEVAATAAGGGGGASSAVSELELQRNALAAVPASLASLGATLTRLDLSNNQLRGDDYFYSTPARPGPDRDAYGRGGAAVLALPALRELSLAANGLTSLAPLLARLAAPALQKLDVSANRVAGALPVLRRPTPAAAADGGGAGFPRLTVLLAAHNRISELGAPAVRGLRVLDCSSNELAGLDPRIGLLGRDASISGGGGGGRRGDDGGHAQAVLERLDVRGNRFRVPRWEVLERGTEATLEWLRGRIPAGEEEAEEEGEEMPGGVDGRGGG